MREEEENEQKQEQTAPCLQEGPAGSFAVTLGHMPSAAAGWRPPRGLASCYL